eukprot:NODE_4582_length_659_cov_513.859272.p4 GENE.NODE_4582_length_659_cov_513.859272~~NODE_4582_length_659_cov_513.859272.p4  ORF type:complete len:118 (+),score=27.98 NODE_4582_length_659_cov_513.859272:3-356(+)
MGFWSVAPPSSPSPQIASMRPLPLAAAAALCLSALARAAQEPMTNEKCGVQCQQFNFHGLGPKFEGIAHPNECKQKCDKVYPKASANKVSVGRHSVADTVRLAATRPGPSTGPIIKR